MHQDYYWKDSDLEIEGIVYMNFGIKVLLKSRTWVIIIYHYYFNFFIINLLEFHFGLIFHNFTAKPAYNAVKNLLHLLRDPGPEFTPKNIDLNVNVTEVDGFFRTDFVHWLIFQKVYISFLLFFFFVIVIVL